MNNYIFNGEIKTIGGILFSFNNPVQGAVQLIGEGDSIMIHSPVAIQYMSMQGQQAGVITDTAFLAQQSGTINANELTSLGFKILYTINTTSFIIPKPVFAGKIVYFSGDKSDVRDKDLLSMVGLEFSSGNEKDTVMVAGGKGVTAYSTKTTINKLEVSVGYGSKIIKTSLSLRCDDFKLDRYPGSDNASSYESRVTVIDYGKETPHHIYMNNVLDYSGYRFFQASYFPDESGTFLSVNKDWWGTRIADTGYFFYSIGCFLHFPKANSYLEIESKAERHT